MKLVKMCFLDVLDSLYGERVPHSLRLVVLIGKEERRILTDIFYNNVHTVESPRVTRDRGLQSKRLSLCEYM